MEISEQFDKILPALAASQNELKSPAFDRENKHFNMKYASFSAFRDAVVSVLARHDLICTHDITSTESGVGCQFSVFHASGQFVKWSRLDLPLAKHDAQAYGSAITYAKRYTLSSALFLVGDDDDDANAAQNPLMNHNASVGKWIHSICVIKDGIATNSLETAVEAWEEIPEEDKRSLWIAETKGGVFTTNERKVMKGDEWSSVVKSRNGGSNASQETP